MGGGKRFEYPKYVWSPSGGWWCEPRNWRRNTAIGFGMIFAACVPICWLSWQLENALWVEIVSKSKLKEDGMEMEERRPVPPYRHIFSQRFAKHAKEDDPSLP